MAYGHNKSEVKYSTIDEREAAELTDSDDDLAEAFSSGKLKPGLVDLRGEGGGAQVQREFVNNVKGLKNKLIDLKLDAPWIERLDFISEPAALAPELSVEIQEHAQKRQRITNNKTQSIDIDEDPLHNDFKREMSFYRQAQAAVLDGYKRLQELNLSTMRPSDYFAEMAKSDDHMQKIRNRLMKKQKGLEISERVKKIREIRKYGKKVQVEAEQRKVKEKKDMIDTLNKYRKGKIDNIDFLEGSDRKSGEGSKSKSKVKGGRPKAPFGKNRYTKRNTAEDVDNYPTKKGGKGKNPNKFAPKSGKAKRNARPGKLRRNTLKNKDTRKRRK